MIVGMICIYVLTLGGLFDLELGMSLFYSDAQTR